VERNYVLLITSTFGWPDQYQLLAETIVATSQFPVVSVMLNDGRGLGTALGVPAAESDGPDLSEIVAQISNFRPVAIFAVSGDADLLKELDLPQVRTVVLDSSTPPAGAVALFSQATFFSVLDPAVKLEDMAAARDLAFSPALVERGQGIVGLSSVCDFQPGLGEVIRQRGLPEDIAVEIDRRCGGDGPENAANLMMAVGSLLAATCPSKDVRSLIRFAASDPWQDNCADSS
jgi:hypothetical protein